MGSVSLVALVVIAVFLLAAIAAGIALFARRGDGR